MTIAAIMEAYIATSVSFYRSNDFLSFTKCVVFTHFIALSPDVLSNFFIISYNMVVVAVAMVISTMQEKWCID